MSDKTVKDWKKIKEEMEMQTEDTNEELAEEMDESLDAGHSLEHPSYQELEKRLTSAEQKAHESWEKATRAMAEAENVRNRAQRDIENAHRYALSGFVDSLVPVMDSLEQALQLANQTHDTAMCEGLELTTKLFIDVFKKYHVEQLNPQGEAFNPEFHEAMSIQESAEASNTILAVFQKGYTLNNRVIRPARVVVAK